MKRIKLISIVILVFSLLLFTQTANELITSAQTLTTSFADLGGEIDCSGKRYLILYVEIDINQANNIRILALRKHTSAGSDEYYSPILTVGSSDIKVEYNYIEFNVDEDRKYAIIYDLTTTNDTKYIQFQAMMGTDGGTDAQIDSAYYAKAN